MNRRALLLGLLLVLAAAPASAAGTTQAVNVQFDAFSPTPVDALPGETVAWSNVSPRVHTVTSDAGLFGTDELLPGAVFSQRFDAPGAYAYHCAIHPEMTGEIDVRRVILGPLPTAAVALGARVELDGRTADPSRPVEVQRSVRGAGFVTVASAAPTPEGSWRATVAAEATGDYRAVVGGDASQARRLLVRERRVTVRATRRGIAMTVTPSVPYARVMLQADLHERFGWWPIARGRLDYLSQASFRVQRPARVRAVLVAKDGWTPLATSSVLVLGRAKATPMGGHMHMHD
ncbi:MAG TPA: cupredoxin domain-containing protein [Conexibacter sp.]|nr:cupredoxin domain-containing protein [Conexibacter sp.]